MKRLTTKMLGVLLAVALLATTLAACSGGGSSSSAPASAAPASEAAESTGSEAAADTGEKSIYDMTKEELIAAAQAEGSVTFAVWHDEALWKEIGDGFTEEYGIKFEIAVGEKQALTSKVIAEKDGATGTIDVMKVGGEDVKTTIDAGVFMGPTLPSIWSKDELDPGLSVRQEGVEHGGYLVPLHRNQTGLLINPDYVENAPQTWEELEAWIEENPLRFGFCEPAEGGSGQAMVLMAVDHLTGGLDQYQGDVEVDEAKTESWSEVWQWFNDRKDKVTITTSNKDSLSRLNQGELWMVVAWDDQTTSTVAAGELFKNAELYIPELGMPGGGDSAGLLANAPHPAAGLLLLDYLTDVKAQEMMNSVLNTYPARVDVAVQNTSIDPADMVNRTEWIPAAYKAKFINDFTEQVLMVG